MFETQSGEKIEKKETENLRSGNVPTLFLADDEHVAVVEVVEHPQRTVGHYHLLLGDLKTTIEEISKGNNLESQQFGQFHSLVFTHRIGSICEENLEKKEKKLNKRGKNIRRARGRRRCGR